MTETATYTPPEVVNTKILPPLRRQNNIAKSPRLIKEEARNVTFIYNKIVQTRDSHLEQEKNKQKQDIAYPLETDTITYRQLAKHKNTPGYEEARHSVSEYTKMQLKTHIGERLHVEISKFEFTTKNGELWPENGEEPMLNMIKRGVQYRRYHGNPIDWARESAEVTGFEKIQNVLTDQKTPEGTLMLSISPQGDTKYGSIYTHNFYDIYQKTSAGVVAYRFTSGLSAKESQEKLSRFDKRYAPAESVLTDDQFLANPVRIDPIISPYSTPQEIHNYLHKEHNHMSLKEFHQVIKECAPLITSYINTLCDNPGNLIKQEQTFNALLNYADILAGKVQAENIFPNKFIKNQMPLYEKQSSVRPWIPTQNEIGILAAKTVRFVNTGCGASGSRLTGTAAGRSYTSSQQFSIVESSTMGSVATEWFKCPKCTYKANGPIGDGPCPGCGLTKEEFAAETGISCD
jgi:hypothetical protein